MTIDFDDAPMPSFDSRWTMRHERSYPHPIERVFAAVSQEEHLNEWLHESIKGTRVDPRPGGGFFVHIVDAGGIVTVVEPPHVIEYSFVGEAASSLRFELETIEGGTKLAMLYTWGPMEMDEAHWDSSFTAGWHMMLHMLGDHLAGRQVGTIDHGETWESLQQPHTELIAAKTPPVPEVSPLATMDGPLAMRHVRVYPHPVERVWEAVTTAKHMNEWFLAGCEIDARIGGDWSMTFGDARPEATPVTGTLVAFDPPHVIDFGGMRYELEPVEGGAATRLTFTQSFAPDFRQPYAGDPGADLPGGPGSPWNPGFVSGFHMSMDDLGRWLDGEVIHQPMVNGQHVAMLGVRDPMHDYLTNLYRAHLTTALR